MKIEVNDLKWVNGMKIGTFICACALFSLMGCAASEVILPGDRHTLDGIKPRAARFVIENIPSLSLSTATRNKEWTHQGGNAQHNPGHLELGEVLELQWTASVGAGNDRKYQISSSPIVRGGLIFTLDSKVTLSATDLNGSVLWQKNLAADVTDHEDVSGGGIAVVGDKVFATTGFGAVLALDVKNGNEIWRQNLSSFGSSSPTVYRGLLYLSARDGAAWAIDAETGRVKWQMTGPEVLSSIVGGPGPAVTSKWALFPFGSGEVFSTFRKGGLRNWASVLSGARLGRASAQVTDLTGQPVIDGERVYLANSAGRMVALDLDDGRRIWTSKHGSQGTLTLGGRSLFSVNDEGLLLRLSADDGALIWSTPLPHFTKKDVKKRSKIYVHYGPILAGGRLIIMSSDGQMREFNPFDGSLLKQTKLPAPAASGPVVVDGTLYMISIKGDLLAFR